jgi:U3 small nucleolar RNA-associated protein 10
MDVWLLGCVDSTSDDSCHTHLIETIETLPLKTFVERIAFKVLGNCVKMSQATDNPDIKHTGIVTALSWF